MPQLNKVQVRTLVRTLIDDPAGKQWPTGTLDLLIEGCLDELWGELLDQFPWLNSAEDGVASTAAGVVAVSSLTQRLYRIQRLVRDGRAYHPTGAEEVVVSNGVALEADNFTYANTDTEIWVFPFATSPTVYVRYNYLPEPFTSLTPGPDPDSQEDDAISFVSWPDGYHMAYIYDIAAKALEKGDKEDSKALSQRAVTSMFRLKAYLRKHKHVGPVMPRDYDSPLNIGGV